MRKWMRGARGMLAIVALWIVGWGLGFGGLAEVFVDPSGETLDIWPAEMAIPGFCGGIVFALLVRIAEGRRSFDAVSLPRFATWGVLTGLLLGVLTITSGGPIPLSISDLEMLGLATGLGTVAGAGTGVFFHLVGSGPGSAIARWTAN